MADYRPKTSFNMVVIQFVLDIVRRQYHKGQYPGVWEDNILQTQISFLSNDNWVP